jgi:hypothetical protein
MSEHALTKKATAGQVATAREAADWLLDAIACATQDRRLLRGDPAYDETLGEAVLANGTVACLRAHFNLTEGRVA